VKESGEGGQRGDWLRTEEEERDLLQRKNLLSHPTLVDLEKKIISKSTNPSIQHSIPQTKDLILYGVEIYIIINIWYEIVASPSECQKEREGAEPVVSNSTDRPDHTERE